MKKKEKTWTDNLIQYLKTKDYGTCPKCGSENILVSEYVRGKHRSLTFRCADCCAGVHIDGKRDRQEVVWKDNKE